MSIIYKFPQGSVEWSEARRGIPTASQFEKIITPTGKPSEQAVPYMNRLIAEILLNESMDDQLHVEWVERGKELEPHARAQFQFLENCEVELVGFVTDNDGKVGCSPDGVIKDKPEAVEIKCPAPWTQIGYLLDGPGPKYKPQVQGQLMIGDFERVHFYSYHPSMPALHLITLPDKAYQKLLRQYLADFLETLDARLDRARSLGAYAAARKYVTPLDRTAPAPEPLSIILP